MPIPSLLRAPCAPRFLSLLTALSVLALTGASVDAHARPEARASHSTKGVKTNKAGKSQSQAGPRTVRGTAAVAAGAGVATASAADQLAASSGLPAPVIDAMRRAQVPMSAASFYVIRVGAPTPAANWNAQKPMNPASTMKLVTTFAGLQLLGPGYRWQTTLYSDREPDSSGVLRGNLYLRGQGDPKLVPEEMDKLVASLRRAGVETIDGDVVLDRSYFDDGLENGGTIDGEIGRAYNVSPDALLYAFKTLSFRLAPDAGAQSVDVSMTPALAQVKIDNRLQLTNGKCGDWRARAAPTLVPQTDGTVLASFAGSFSADCGEQTYNVAALSHNDFIVGGFMAEWLRAGGRFARPPTVRSGTVPRGSIVLARHRGLPLSDIVRDINKYSNNVMARQLFLTVGAESERGARASTALSSRVVHRWLARQGLDMPELVLDNGSGLSRQERISAYDMNRLLQQALASEVGADFVESLPILGVDGTLRNRLTRAGAAGSGYLKTGTLADVRALAGYVDALNGQRFVVVALINHPNASQALEAHDALLQWVYRGAGR